MQNFSEIEKKILKFWQKNKVFEKSIKQRAKAQDFVFYEGPPTANAKPGIHHVLARAFKDIICRYKTMQGFRVLRKAGWDCHGLPVELQVEKKIGLKNKKEIEEYGIAKFNKICQKSVWQYKKDWEKLTQRIGFWLDMENPYITSNASYMESVFNIIKQISDKGLLYQDYKVTPYCPRCGTGLSSHEVAQGYKKIKEPAIYVKFEIKKGFKFQVSGFKTHLLIWTTTPWTLPGNVAIAVNPKITYILTKKDKEYLIIAKERKEVLGQDFEVLKEIKGKELIGLSYEPIFDRECLDLSLKNKEIYKILSANFVDAKEGTGLVHIAPAFGQDDMELIKTQNAKRKTQNKEECLKAQNKNNEFPILLTVDEQGKFKNEVKKWVGMFVKKADPLIIEYLKGKDSLFKEEQYEHDYPFCWRCKSPLLYYAKKGWFIKMSILKDKLLKNNEQINWVPAHLKQGRFGEWLREVKDWNLSRERYWGTPLPVWKCEKCKHQEFIGSKKDLLKQKFTTNNYYLLRHGESLRQINKLAACWPEKFHCPLTLKGKKQIKKSVKKLKKENIDLIFSSDLLRTKQTAEIIKKELGIKLVKFDKRLRESNAGIFNGKPTEEVARFWDPEKKLSEIEYYLKRFKLRAPKGESWLDIKKRMYDFLISVDKKYKGKKILIVSHELPLSMLEGATKGLLQVEFIKFRKKSKLQVGQYKRIDFKILPYNNEGDLDFHRPYIDEVKFCCPKCKNLMERVLEVVDCWFDAGAMPFAQRYWSKNNNLKLSKFFPADYISEGIDQTRGWFYTLLAISTLLGFGSPYKNVISLGHILDEKGEKMSKSKGNIVDPWQIIEKYGSDAIRWYFYIINQPGDSKFFSEKELKEIYQKNILLLLNILAFYQEYANPVKNKISNRAKNPKAGHILDKWILSRLNCFIHETTNKMDNYDVVSTSREIKGFISDLSLWYLRRSRDRFKQGDIQGMRVFGDTLFQLSLIIAPFMPFLADYIYQVVTNQKKKSVHLEDWSKVDKKLINKKLNQKMEKVREIVSLALAERVKAGIRVRQPLASLQIPNFKSQIPKELLELIKEEINVRKITFGKSFKLDTKITQELKEEGVVREIIREIQGLRKKKELKPKDKIIVEYIGPDKQIFEKNKKIISEQTNIKKLVIDSKKEKLITIKKL